MRLHWPGRWERLGLGYTDPQGFPALRQEICALYTRVSWEDIIVAAPQELISMAFHAMLRPGDHVVAVFPGYQSLYEIAQHIGCHVSFWEPEEQKDGSFVFDVRVMHDLCHLSQSHLVSCAERYSIIFPSQHHDMAGRDEGVPCKAPVPSSCMFFSSNPHKVEHKHLRLRSTGQAACCPYACQQYNDAALCYFTQEPEERG